jgi:sugar lactone lactonase YvrE
MVGLVDELRGGVIAYFLDPDTANESMLRLNDFKVDEDCRYWITHALDPNQLEDLEKSIKRYKEA